MPALFDPFEFSGLKIRNRFVRSATVNNLTDAQNRFTKAHWKLYTDLARGGSGASYSPSGPIDEDEWHEGYLIEYCAQIAKINR